MGASVAKWRFSAQVGDALAPVSGHANIETRKGTARSDTNQQRMVARVLYDQQRGITHVRKNEGTLLDVHGGGETWRGDAKDDAR